MAQLIDEIKQWNASAGTASLTFFVSEAQVKEVEGDLILNGFTEYIKKKLSKANYFESATYKMIVSRSRNQ